MTRIIVGSVFNLRNVQNKSNAEGDLKSAAMATLQEVQTDLQLPAVSNKACPHLTAMNRGAVMPHRFAFSHHWSPFLFTVGYRRGAEDAVGFPQTGQLAVAQVAMNNCGGNQKNHFGKQAERAPRI